MKKFYTSIALILTAVMTMSQLRITVYADQNEETKALETETAWETIEESVVETETARETTVEVEVETLQEKFNDIPVELDYPETAELIIIYTFKLYPLHARLSIYQSTNAVFFA